MSIYRSVMTSGGPVDTAWNVAFAVFNDSYGSFFTGAEDDTPTSGFFKDDGTKLYVLGNVGDEVNEYSLSTAWDISTASYVQTFSVTAQETAPRGIFFKGDGTKMYICGTTGDDVNEYSLSTAWNISTASYVQNFSVSAQDTAPISIFFKPDGTKMYVLGNTGDDVNEYNLSSAWDISTASYVQNFSVSAEETDPRGVFFKDDGTKMYICGVTGDDVNEYSLSTAWNISTASYVQNFSVSAQDTQPQGMFFKPDGTKIYIFGTSTKTAYEYNLSSAWDISTAAWAAPATNYYNVAAEETIPSDIFFKDDGTKMYICGLTGDDVNEYNLSSAWDISTASYYQNASVNTNTIDPRGMFFKPDGTKLYFIHQQEVDQYDLSSAWDVSTISYVQSFSVSAQEGFTQALFFKDDGTKMYIVGHNARKVFEYDLSSAWNISTASYLQDFSINTYFTANGLFFKDDGTKMYVLQAGNDRVEQYALSTAWNVTTASFEKNFSVVKADTFPSGIFFKNDGTKMYIVGSDSDAVWSYDI